MNYENLDTTSSDSEKEAKMVGLGSTIEVDSQGNATEIPMVTKEKLYSGLDAMKRVVQPVIDHVSKVREEMKKEGK